MKDNPVYSRYDTNNNNKTLQRESVNKGSFDWEYIENDEYTIMYNAEDIRKSTEIKIHSKTKFRERPKSAGDVIKKPNAAEEVLLIKKAISLSNIEDFFLKRRIPLIKPLISEREILKLQLLQEQCRKKRTHNEHDKRSLQVSDVEHKDLKSVEEKPEDETGDVTLPFLDSKGKGPQLTQPNLKEDDKKTRTPISDKSKQEAKKMIKDLTAINGAEKRKKEKKGINKLDVDSAQKGESKTTKDKPKASTDKEIKTTKSDAKTKDRTKSSDSKDKTTKSQDKIIKDMKHKDSNTSGKKASKQKLKSGLSSEKDILPKGGSNHSKEGTSQEKKSDKSDKSESSKSKGKSDSLKKRKEKDKDVKEQDVEDKLGKMKPPSEDSQKNKKDVKDVSKGDKKTKPGANSERPSVPLTKDKQKKTIDGKTSVKKSVKFPHLMQHVIHYVLSNPLFLQLGWTLGPSDKAQQQMVIFRAVPVTPNTYCFRERTEEEIKYYSKYHEKVAFHFRTDGTGEIFYPSGVSAAVITKHDTGTRLTLYSDPKNDPLIDDSFISKVLAIFDSYGNGVVYDVQGRKLLNFNQLEGIFCSPHRKSPYKWQWCDYKILDKQRLKALLRYMAKEQKQPVPAKKGASSTIGSRKKSKPEEKKVEKEIDEVYEQILAELPCPVPQKTKTKSESHSWGFKPITLKINSEMTLRINSQDDITLIFSANKIFLRIDLGVKIDPDVVERIEELAHKSISDVPCLFDIPLDGVPQDHAHLKKLH